MAKVIPFVMKQELPPIDWERIEAERKITYPKLPRKAITLIRHMVEHPSKYSIAIDDDGQGYPPKVIEVLPRESAIHWVIDLLDRFGGTLSSANREVRIKRVKQRVPIYEVVAISANTHVALTTALGGEFEHFARSNEWQMIGKELPQTELMIVLVSPRKAQGTFYLGLFDRQTILVLMRRLGEGLSIETLIEWGR